MEDREMKSGPTLDPSASLFPATYTARNKTPGGDSHIKMTGMLLAVSLRGAKWYLVGVKKRTSHVKIGFIWGLNSKFLTNIPVLSILLLLLGEFSRPREKNLGV